MQCKWFSVGVITVVITVPPLRIWYSYCGYYSLQRLWKASIANWVHTCLAQCTTEGKQSSVNAKGQQINLSKNRKAKHTDTFPWFLHWPMIFFPVAFEFILMNCVDGHYLELILAFKISPSFFHLKFAKIYICVLFWW